MAMLPEATKLVRAAREAIHRLDTSLHNHVLDEAERWLRIGDKGKS